MEDKPIQSSQKPIWFVTAGWLVTIALLIGLAWSAWSSYLALDASIRRSFEIQELRGRIVYLDEVLTMSARMAAATGDLSWEKRYNENLPLIFKAIDQAMVILPGFQGLKQTETANAELARLESETFKQLHAGNAEAAKALLFGADYVHNKEIYAQGMQALGQQLQQAAEATTNVQKRRALFHVVAAAGGIPPLIVGWLVVLRVLRRWRQELLTNHQHLLDLNRDLDAKVATRTTQLAAHATELEGLNRLSQERAASEASLSALNTSLHGNVTVAEVAEKGLAGVVEYLGAPMGAVFVLAADGLLHRLSAYAYPQDSALPKSFAVGSGIVGQAAHSRRPIFSNPDQESLRVQFGFGAVSPAHILAYPLSANETVLGIMELCLFKPLTETETSWLAKVSATVADALRFALEREERTQAEERTRLILESSAEGIFGTDTEGGITFVNPAACRMLGFSAEELIGQPSHATFHHHRPDGREYLKEECPMFAAYKSGKASRIDDEFLWRKDGTGLPVEYGATPICKDGAVVGSVVSFTDITLRKQQEAELLTQHSALESAANAIVITDRKGTIMWVNPAFVRLTGFEREEAIGQNPRVLNSGVHEKEFFRDMWQTVLAGSVWQGTVTNKRKNGVLYEEEMTITPVRSKGGEITHFVAVKQDITERLHAEQRLRETEQFFRSVLELAPDGLRVADAKGVIQLANAQCEKLFGYPRTELIGQPVETLVPADIRARHPALREAFHRAPHPRSMGSGRELRGQRKDGSLFPVEIGLSPLPAREGESAQVAVSIRDITERKQQEQEILAAKANG